MPDVLAKTNLKSIFIGSAGNLVEFYDWYVYPNFALYFSKAFFPPGDQTAQLLSAAAVFAVGFLMRPVGGWLLGLYADRKGRRPALILCMVLMALGSAGIGLIPGYGKIGVLAPTLLVVSRLVQGVAISGQYAASASYLSEVANRGNRGFWTSFHYVTLLAGLMLGELVLFILQHTIADAEIVAWAWRVPFLFGAVLAIVSLIITLGADESQSFEAAQTKTKKVARFSLLLKSWHAFLTVFAITTAGTVAFQTYGTYMPQYLVNTAGFSPLRSTEITMAAMMVYTLMHPLMGWISDLIGRRATLVIFAGTSLVATYPVMTSLAASKDPVTAFWLLLLGLTLLSPYTAVSAIFKSELFPTEIRVMAIGLSFSLPITIFGGTLPSVALYFKKIGHEPWYYWYITASFAVALVAAWFMPRSDGTMIGGAK